MVFRKQDTFYEQLKVAFLKERWILIDKTDYAKHASGKIIPMLVHQNMEQFNHPNYIFYYSYERMVTHPIHHIIIVQDHSHEQYN
jgi:hypothetical protein